MNEVCLFVCLFIHRLSQPPYAAMQRSTMIHLPLLQPNQPFALTNCLPCCSWVASILISFYVFGIFDLSGRFQPSSLLCKENHSSALYPVSTVDGTAWNWPRSPVLIIIFAACTAIVGLQRIRLTSSHRGLPAHIWCRSSIQFPHSSRMCRTVCRPYPQSMCTTRQGVAMACGITLVIPPNATNVLPKLLVAQAFFPLLFLSFFLSSRLSRINDKSSNCPSAIGSPLRRRQCPRSSFWYCILSSCVLS
jgi:hypothetical protein